MGLIIALGAAVSLFSVFRLVLGTAVPLLSAFHIPVVQFDLRFLLLALITIGISSRLTIQIPRVQGQVTVSDTFIFITMLLYGGEAAILLAAIPG
jgi:hypothetical protein